MMRKRSECNCMCHVRPDLVRHCKPCCWPDDAVDEFRPERKD